MKAEEFEQEWKRYCDSKGGGAVTISIKDVANHFAQWQKEQMMKDAIEGEVIDKGDFIKFADGKYIDLNPTMGAEPFIKLEDGDKVKVIIIKE